MALIRWEPFEGLTSLRRDMDRLFEDFMGRMPSRLGEGTAEPAVEVSDTPEAVVVKAQVPFKPKVKKGFVPQTVQSTP